MFLPIRILTSFDPNWQGGEDSGHGMEWFLVRTPVGAITWFLISPRFKSQSSGPILSTGSSGDENRGRVCCGSAHVKDLTRQRKTLTRQNF